MRSAPKARIFCPQRLSGFAGLLPHTGSRDVAVAKSGFGGAVAAGEEQRARRPEVVEEQAAVEQAMTCVMWSGKTWLVVSPSSRPG